MKASPIRSTPSLHESPGQSGPQRRSRPTYTRKEERDHTASRQAREWYRWERQWGLALRPRCFRRPAWLLTFWLPDGQTPTGPAQKTRRWLCTWAICLCVGTARVLLAFAERLVPPHLRVRKPTGHHRDYILDHDQEYVPMELSDEALRMLHTPNSSMPPDQPWTAVAETSSVPSSAHPAQA